MDFNYSEAYSQRYQTWRHLDGIRYQIVQLSIASVGAIAVISKLNTNPIETWVFAVFGLVFFGLGGVLSKVNSAIRRNGMALKKFGDMIGDSEIPDVSIKGWSIFHYISAGYFILGISCFLFASIKQFS